MTFQKLETGAGVHELMNVLAFNSGSSSLKFGLYLVEEHRLTTLFSETIANVDQELAIARVIKNIADSNLRAPDVIGHRIVHSGPRLQQHCLIDESVMLHLESAIAFAPLHMPAALSLIRLAQAYFPGLPQVACFDTSFHADLPDVARVLPIPKEYQAERIQRYGFHGLSCESIIHQLGVDTPGRMVIAHLGNGASVTAVKDGKSIDTSMGLTPAGGVMMGTRSGDLDPGVLLYLLREKKIDVNSLDEMINHRSGLLGVSGQSADMRDLQESSAVNADARLAVQMFCYSVQKQVAAMISVLDGIDMLVFTGGIGENHASVRSGICKGLSWMGVHLDEVRNGSKSHFVKKSIGNDKSRCRVAVLESLEDEQIVHHSRELIVP